MGSCFSKHPSLLEIQGASKHPEGVTKRIQEQQPVAQPVAAGPVIHFTLVLSDGQHIEVSTPGSDPVSILPQMVVDGASDAEPLELSDLLSVSLADGALWQSGTKPACPTLLTGGVPEIAKGQPTLAACGVMDQVSCPGCPCISGSQQMWLWPADTTDSAASLSHCRTSKRRGGKTES